MYRSLTINYYKDVAFKAKYPSVLKIKVKNNLQFDIYAELESDFNIQISICVGIL